MRLPGISDFLTTRPAWSAGLAAAFLGLAVAFAAGWAPRASAGAGVRGETLVMALVCTVIAGHFVRCARLGWRQRRASSRPPSTGTRAS